MMERVPNVINPSDAQRAAYAAANGYKVLITTPQPGRYWRRDEYVETPNGIYEIWTTLELEYAKKDALERVQHALDTALDARAAIPCEGFPSGIVYDRNALINVGGLAAGDVFIDAADGLHSLTDADVAAITAALKEYRQSLYAHATAQRAEIAAATTVDELPQD